MSSFGGHWHLSLGHHMGSSIRKFVFVLKEKMVRKRIIILHKIVLTSLNEPSSGQLQFGVLVPNKPTHQTLIKLCFNENGMLFVFDSGGSVIRSVSSISKTHMSHDLIPNDQLHRKARQQRNPNSSAGNHLFCFPPLNNDFDHVSILKKKFSENLGKSTWCRLFEDHMAIYSQLQVDMINTTSTKFLLLKSLCNYMLVAIITGDTLSLSTGIKHVHKIKQRKIFT